MARPPQAVAHEDVDVLLRHHRVEHQPAHAVGVRAGVALGEIRPVRDAEDVDAVRAQRGPHRLQVLHRVGGRVERPSRAEPRPARFDGAGRRHGEVGQRLPLQRRAAHGGRARPALVEDGDPPSGHRPEESRERRPDADHALAGAAAERDQDGSAALHEHRQRQRARRGAGAVQRHRHRQAAKRLGTALPRRPGRRGRPCEHVATSATPIAHDRRPIRRDGTRRGGWLPCMRLTEGCRSG